MARVWRVLRWFLVVLLVLLLVAAGFAVWTVRRSFPQTEGTATLAALDGEVTVHRDAWGVPHLFGDSVEDLARAQGYVHAQDRFWEMDVRRHVTAGRLSELFGPDQVETDAFIRTIGWRRVAEAELAILDDQTITLLEAYAEGVNAWLADRSPAELSLEYAILGLTSDLPPVEPWEPADSVAWFKAMAWDLRSNAGDEVRRALSTATLPLARVEQLDPPYPFDRFDPIVTADGTEFTIAALLGATAAGGGLGSNSWAVSGQRTTTGGAILANDPHLAPSMPGIWHQVGLHCRTRSADCPLDVSGFSFSGFPGVVIGRNDQIAWGLTNLASDVSDHYVLRTDGDRYEFDGEWRDMTVRTETIEVTGGDDVEVTIRWTHQGPVLSDVSEELRDILDLDLPGMGVLGQEGHGVAMRWTALEPGTTASALYGINTARSWDEFRAAAELFDVPAQNLLYADADGHIGYQAPGRHPIRAEGHDGRWPVAGWTSETEWQGYIPFDDLPSVLDPDAGFIVTANEAVVGPDYAYDFPGEWAPGFRGERIEQLLAEAVDAGPVDAAAVAAIQLDNHIGLADILLPALRGVQVDGHAAEALALLDGWDGQMDADSPEAAFFGGVMRHLMLGTFADDLPDELPPNDRGGWWLVLEDLLDDPDDPFWDDTTTDAVEDRDDILERSVLAADEEVSRLLGTDLASWAWGDLHGLTMTHGTLGESGIGPVEAIFNRGPVATGGSGSVPNATGWTPVDGYGITWVPSMRMVVDLSAPDEARWINLTGQSGHAYHPHYGDMAPLWAVGETVPWHQSSSAIEAAAVDTLVLTP